MNNINTSTNILITGAAGFIGSCMASFLNSKGYKNIYLVDDFGVEIKRKNWEAIQRINIIERYNLFNWLTKEKPTINFIIHLGARTDTTEFNYEVHRELNYNYSIHVWQYAVQNNIPFVYASSAATYGDGSLGYEDTHEIIQKLQPLNPYGVSKNEFDKWAVKQTVHPPSWAGLKFFNVYGPNEYHKGRMASVIWHSFNQIKNNGVVKLFKSHKDGFEDG
ncbi:MAG TPA: NAD-dependent epimerase/dehydratase family protein, partial [Chitinophagaceae bacterium]|nr:NAD-dependent epimerase/dehydratase family protein [Chitinophagaceae bacterium]